MNNHGATILVVDQELEIVRVLRRSLTAHSYTVLVAKRWRSHPPSMTCSRFSSLIAVRYSRASISSTSSGAPIRTPEYTACTSSWHSCGRRSNRFPKTDALSSPFPVSATASPMRQNYSSGTPPGEDTKPGTGSTTVALKLEQLCHPQSLPTLAAWLAAPPSSPSPR
jgi:hypothetical protein